MGIALKQSTASQEIALGHFVDDTDGKTAETGLTIANTDIKLWKNGATTLANKNSGGATHISGGIYYATLDSTDTDTVGPMVIFVAVSGALAVRLECHVYEEAIFDALFGASATGLLPANVTQFGGSAGTFSGGRPEVNTTHIAGSSVSTSSAQIGVNVVNAGGTAWASGAITASVIADNAIDAGAIASDAITAAKIADGAIDAATFATGAITAAAIASDAITDAKVASDVTIASVTGAVGSVTGNVGGNVVGSVGSVTGNVGGNVVGSVGSISGVTFPTNFGSTVISAGGVVSADATAISGDSTAADRLETMLDGTGGQTLSLGALSVVNSSGSAVTITSSGGNGHGIVVTGNGTGEGIKVTAGATGYALELNGGATSGGAIYCNAPDDNCVTFNAAANHHALLMSADGSEPTWEINNQSTGVLIQLGDGATNSSFNANGYYTGNLTGTLSTLTTYTGNTPQTGDSFARIGATGSGLTSLAPAALLTTALTESYRGTGATGTATQLLYEILQNLTEFGISSTTKTVKRLDGSTTAKTYSLDSSTSPTSITETT